MDKKRPVVLCILDGWGIGDGGEYDATARADTPCFDTLMNDYPHTTLDASGLPVGLPDGQMGNSEVGHMNIGAGRVVMQFLPRINKAFEDDEVKDYTAIREMIASLKQSGKACHIMGLLSDGGVHSHMDHIIALAKIIGDEGVRAHLHGFTDGRDCPPESGKGFVARTLLDIDGHKNISLSSLCGRYYAMDRDKRWERIKRAYDMIVSGEGKSSDNALEAMQESYDAGITDEFVEPVVFGGYKGVQPGDAMLFANFRNDRPRQLSLALAYKGFDGFEREMPEFSHVISMSEYSDVHAGFMKALFPPLQHKNILGEVLSAHGLKQVRIAETEKYGHVTFYFNCGHEEPYEGEERILVPSPKVATYDLQPEMSAPEISENLLRVVEEGLYDVVIVNFANGDMVGHTGSLEAVVKGLECVDKTLCKLRSLVLEKGGVLMITADHGNAELMYDAATDGPHTAHTTNPVPFIVIGADDGTVLREGGKLGDIAPTILHFLGIEQPEEMTGEVLTSP